MARPKTGSLVWRKKGWFARIWTLTEGEWIRVPVDLETTNKLVAKRKMARLVAEANAGTAAEDVGTVETFELAAERVHKLRVADGVKSAKDELRRLRAFAFEALGGMRVTDIKAADVNAALDHTKAQGKGRQTAHHVRQAIRTVLAQLCREGVLESNPADDSEMPKFPETVQKERAVLTDAELAVYLAWVHPEEPFREAVLERQVMACVARMFGGLRTGDLHSLRWEAFDVEHGAFTWGWAPRRKTKRPQLLEVPEMLRPIFRDWWERAGRPTAGLVFPVRKGEKAGEAERKKSSHAKAFRRDLERAFGVLVLETRKTTRRAYRVNDTRRQWRRVRDWTARERELFSETAYTLPVDFHSWRRAYSQALGDAGINAQQAQALTGHASLAAHARYLANSGKLRRIPSEALPRLGVLAAPRPKLPGPETETSMFSGGRTRDRTVDIRLVRPALYR